MAMTMDWESWLRDSVGSSATPDGPQDKKVDLSQALLLGLPVALPQNLAEVPDVQHPPIQPSAESRDQPSELEPGPDYHSDGHGREQVTYDSADHGEISGLPVQTGEEQVGDHAVAASWKGEPGAVEDERSLAPRTESRQDEDVDLPDKVSTFVIPPQPLQPVYAQPQDVARPVFPDAGTEKGARKSFRAPLIVLAGVLIAAWFFMFPGSSYEELILRGDQAYEQENYDEALSLYEKAASESPGRVEPRRGRALALEALGRKGEAVDAWYSCLQASPDSPEAHFRLGELLFSLGSLDGAIRIYQEGAELDPGNPKFFARLGDIFMAREDFKQAADLYRRASTLEPTNSEYRLSLERAEGENRTRDEDERRLRDMGEEQAVMGIASLVAGEYDDAEAHFQRSLDLVPDGRDALLGLAESREGRGDLEGARAAYLKLLDFDPAFERARDAFATLTSRLKLSEETTAVTPPPAGISDDEAGDEEVKEKSVDQPPLIPDTEEDKPASQSQVAVATKDELPDEPPVDRAVLTPTPTEEPAQADKSVVTAPTPAPPVTLVAPGLEAAVGGSVPAKKPKQPAQTSVTKKKAPVTRTTGVVAGKRTEEKLLAESRSLNISGEYHRAVEKASEAMNVRQSPEALSNLGYAHIGLENYPSAFTAYWRRLLLSPELRDPELEPPSFLAVPFESDRWKKNPLPDAQNVPLAKSTESFIFLPAGDGISARVLAGKEYLFEAMRVNPRESGAYINLSLSYVRMQNQKASSETLSTTAVEMENENALYLALLGHALSARGDGRHAADFLHAAEERSSGEVLRFIRSLESANSSKEH